MPPVDEENSAKGSMAPLLGETSCQMIWSGKDADLVEAARNCLMHGQQCM